MQLAFDSHPLRMRLVEEMHMRRMPPLSPPTCMTQTLRLLQPDEREAERAHVLAMPGVPPHALDARGWDANGRAGATEMSGERLSEASTTTVIAPADHDQPFAVATTDGIAWLEDAPGRVLRATKIAIVPDEASAETLVATLPFRTEEPVGGRLGSIRVWSELQLYVRTCVSFV